MQVVYVGLLLFSVTWAAPTVPPQTVKPRRGCVEEHRLKYKGHHEKHGYYIFKYVNTSPGKKNQTNRKQEEKSRDNLALHHFEKRRHQEPSSNENIVQEREKDLSLFEANGKNQSSKSTNLSANRQNEDYSIHNTGKAHNDLLMSVYPEFTRNEGAKNGDDDISKLHDQEEYGVAFIRSNMQHVVRPGTLAELWGKENQEHKPRNVLSKNPSGVDYAKSHSKDKRNHRRDPQAQKSPVKSKHAHHIHIRRNTQYLKQRPRVPKIPSDFEGSGYIDFQERGDNDIFSFSGDGQPSKGIPSQGGAVSPDLESTDVQTGHSGPRETVTINPDTRGPGYNEIPEREENGGKAIGAKHETGEEAGTADISLVEGSNDITGTTNFRELPGKEGNRVDAGSQNAHQGKVEFHYPHMPSKERLKEGSSDTMESANYNEIPKNGRGSSRKGTEPSNRNRVTSNGKQRFSSQGKSQGLLVPSHGLDNDIKNEVGSHTGPNNEENIITHSRKGHYVPRGQNNSTWNKGMSQRKGSWYYRKPHSNRNLSPPRRDESSESDSGSSSESDGD
ncbi:matrix extracellular phosphoglycoprotein [Sciurus carolinensis]|uniref:matrix extracellular phosphoglycoprotein n=1 Tax=Sciurus carolinensis TaxID=30640 RepID=UPI001FB2E5E5|nr:matrix extracellular phosphoglycoprotein [Sciurus carolinensis]